MATSTSTRPRRSAGSAASRSPSWTPAPTGPRLIRAHATAAGARSAACTSGRRPASRVASTSAIAPEPQQRSTRTGLLPRGAERALDQQRAAGPGDEDAGAHHHPEPAVGPAQQVLERLRHPAGDQRLEGLRVVGRLDEEPGLVLGVHTARGPEPGDEGVGHPRRLLVLQQPDGVAVGVLDDRDETATAHVAGLPDGARAAVPHPAQDGSDVRDVEVGRRTGQGPGPAPFGSRPISWSPAENPT